MSRAIVVVESAAEPDGLQHNGFSHELRTWQLHQADVPTEVNHANM